MLHQSTLYVAHYVQLELKARTWRGVGGVRCAHYIRSLKRTNDARRADASARVVLFVGWMVAWLAGACNAFAAFLCRARMNGHASACNIIIMNALKMDINACAARKAENHAGRRR